MPPYELHDADGLVLVSLRVDNLDRRGPVIRHINNPPSEQIHPKLYEVYTNDWDDELWDEELDWFADPLEGKNDSLVIWRFTGGKFSRFSLNAALSSFRTRFRKAPLGVAWSTIAGRLFHGRFSSQYRKATTITWCERPLQIYKRQGASRRSGMSEPRGDRNRRPSVSALTLTQ